MKKASFKKIRVYLNAEFMDLLDFTSSFYKARSSHILRFSLSQRSENGHFKKPKRTQGILLKQKCLQKSQDFSKAGKYSICVLPYFASDEVFAKRGEPKSFRVA
ncbi:hypothetical protein [Helicobacter sp. T3_23-1056]